MMTSLLGDLATFWSVVIVDLALAGDNAIIVGVVAASVPAGQRRQILILGIGIAMLCRIAFSLIAVQLLAIVGLLVAGGLLLLWVAWKMWREIKMNASAEPASNTMSGAAPPRDVPARSRWQAITQIVIADISLSLDNVLAVAGTARHNMWIMAFGLVLSIILMGVAAGVVSRFAARHRWATYLGIAIVAGVGISMVYEGTFQVIDALEYSASLFGSLTLPVSAASAG